MAVVRRRGLVGEAGVNGKAIRKAEVDKWHEILLTMKKFLIAIFFVDVCQKYMIEHFQTNFADIRESVRLWIVQHILTDVRDAVRLFSFKQNLLMSALLLFCALSTMF